MLYRHELNIVLTLHVCSLICVSFFLLPPSNFISVFWCHLLKVIPPLKGLRQVDLRELQIPHRRKWMFHFVVSRFKPQLFAHTCSRWRCSFVSPGAQVLLSQTCASFDACKQPSSITKLHVLTESVEYTVMTRF